MPLAGGCRRRAIAGLGNHRRRRLRSANARGLECAPGAGQIEEVEQTVSGLSEEESPCRNDTEGCLRRIDRVDVELRYRGPVVISKKVRLHHSLTDGEQGVVPPRLVPQRHRLCEWQPHRCAPCRERASAGPRTSGGVLLHRRLAGQHRPMRSPIRFEPVAPQWKPSSMRWSRSADQPRAWGWSTTRIAVCKAD